MSDQSTDSAARPTLAEAMKQTLDRAEFGHHELSDAEAEALVITVYEWMRDYHHIDLLEFRG